VGKTFPELQYRIIDEDGQDVSVGQAGHLIMKGPSMTDGYINNDEANELMFRDGWLHTQDIVESDELGNITIIGRRSNFINVGGLKVFPAEIERVIMNMPEVKDVAVISMQDADWGEVVKAYAVPYPGETLSAEDIRKFCGQHLSSFKVPREVILMDELPKNGIGKVVSHKIQER
jgi:acyl-CoA synthetase (AMP-forming)/AMP-acid ligase II